MAEKVKYIDFYDYDENGLIVEDMIPENTEFIPLMKITKQGLFKKKTTLYIIFNNETIDDEYELEEIKSRIKSVTHNKYDDYVFYLVGPEITDQFDITLFEFMNKSKLNEFINNVEHRRILKI